MRRGLVLGVVWLVSGAAHAAEPEVVGWLETIRFPENGLEVTAKLDTGAKTSAIDAEDVESFEKDGEAWVRFAVRMKKDPASEKRTFEARVVGERKIRAALGRETRRLVDLWVCLAGEKRRVLFTLGSREHMNYRVILGRRALEGRLLVDSARKYASEPGCGTAATSSEAKETK